MQMRRRFIAGLMSALLPLAAWLPQASANEAAGAEWPNRLVKLVVPFPAGSVSDRVARILAQGLEKSFGQTVVVENRPGAGATIGSDYVARAEPDGNTLLLGANASHAVNVSLMKLGYDPIKSFEPISLIAAVPSVLAVNPKLGVNTLEQLIAQVKANPGKLSYTSAGVGTTGHLGMEMLASMTGMNMIHVPARGPGRALQDVMAGHVDMLIESVGLTGPIVKDGRLTGIAVTSQERTPALPEIPTLDEAGAKGYQLTLWFALFAPAGTPQEIITKVHEATVQAFEDPAIREPLERDGIRVITSTPAELTTFQKSEIDKFAKLIKEINLQLTE